MTTKVLGLTISLALIAMGAASPARGQFMSNYPVIIVPPPAQNYAAPKPSPKATPRDRAKSSTDSPEPESPPAYRGQTQQLNRF